MSNGKAASAGAVATSDDLVAAFKASGAFDDLRAELLKSFMRDESGDAFIDRIQAEIKKKLTMLLKDANSRRSLHSSPTRGAQPTSMSPGDRSTLHISPSSSKTTGNTIAGTTLTRAEATEEIMRDLEKYTAYDRAEEDLVKYILPAKRDTLEARLRKVLHERGRRPLEPSELAADPPHRSNANGHVYPQDEASLLLLDEADLRLD
ncbi:hypothetical protein EMMF5_002463 [Cystobasidiomycetes sp. EMM_F5]